MKWTKQVVALSLGASILLAVSGCSGFPGAGPARVDFAKGLTTLNVDVHMANGDVWSHTLICTGDKDPSGECGQLAEFGVERFSKQHKNCVEQENDGWTATVSGVLAGQPVNKTFDKTTDCNAKDWDALSKLFDPDNKWSDDPADYDWGPGGEEFDEGEEDSQIQYDENGLPVVVN